MIFFLKVLMVIIYIFEINDSVALYLQIFLNAGISLMTMINILTNYTLNDRKFNNCLLLVQSFNITMNLVYLIVNLATQDESNEIVATIILLNYSFWAILCLNFKNSSELQDLLNIKEVKDPAKLQFQVTQNLFFNHLFD